MSRSTPWWLALARRLRRRYLPYVQFSLGLFVLGVVAGALLVDVVSLSALLGSPGDVAFPEPTVGLLVVNNSVVLLLLVASGLTLGLGTAVVLVYNGALVGYVSVLAAREGGLATPVVGILPHGVVEIPAILLASAVAFRFAHQVLLAARGRRADVMTGSELRDAIVLVVVALALVPLAAYVEATVTPALLERVAGT